MAQLSASFTLGKASGAKGANLSHNHREFVASNVDATRISDNVTYVNQDVREAYEQLFGDNLREYNARQKRADRKIDDYFSHIDNGKREESFYEIIVQFGDASTAGCGTQGGELAKQLLDEYVRNFAARNSNLHIFSAITHNDEQTPHCHICFIPFYTQARKNSLSKGVSMRAALKEQGFSNTSKKANSLIAWEEAEFRELEKILNRHGMRRDVKGAIHTHLSVEDYKAEKDADKISPSGAWTVADPVAELRNENQYLRTTNEQLTAEKTSGWKAFFFSDSAKQDFIEAKLKRLGIPFRETETGIETPSVHVEQVRKIEKEYVPERSTTSHRAVLQDNLDRIVMQVNSFEEILERLKQSGYTVKPGKYIAVKPKEGGMFIRLRSLGESYSEQSIRNRLVHKARFESEVESNIQAAKPDTLTLMLHKTVRQYTVVFAHGVLPVRKKNKRKPFCWENDAELDRLAELNKKINSGATIAGLRSEFATLEKSVADKENSVATLKTELAFFLDLFNKGERCFKFMQENETDLAVLAKNKVTADNYERIAELIAANESEIAELEAALPDERVMLWKCSDTLTAFEKISAGTYTQSLINAERPKQQAEFYVSNGSRRVD